MKNFNPIVEKIYHKTKDNDLIVLGDRVYSGRYRIQFTKKKHMTLVAKLHLAFLMILIAKKIFYLIKMQVLFVCTERNMALKKAKVGRKWIDILLRKPTILILSIVKSAFQKEDKSKIYSITLKGYEHLFRRYCILKEKLNSATRETLEMWKCNTDMFLIHLDHLVFFYIKLQEATTIFMITMKRIIALLNQK